METNKQADEQKKQNIEKQTYRHCDTQAVVGCNLRLFKMKIWGVMPNM